jgi:16S rRNA (guanine(966)-N(2))-methyltransferase RsmD
MPPRVIAGTAKGRRLKMVPGDKTRPVMDRAKEACFNILGRKVTKAFFLDLFAGTGSVGIEALSRGAKQAVFVELDRDAVTIIQENLTITHLEEQAVIRRTNVLNFLKHSPSQSFDCIYIAPPQYKGLWQETLELLDKQPTWATPTGIVIVQIDPTEQQPISLKHFAPYDERKYGKTLLWFFKRREIVDDEESTV